MAEELAQLAVRQAIRLGARYAEARLEEVSASGFLLNNGMLEGSSFDDYVGLGIRLLANNTWGFASTNDMRSATVTGIVRRAFDVAQAARRTISTKITDEAQSKAAYAVKQKRNLLDVKPAEKIAFIKSADDSLVRSKVPMAGRFISLHDEVVKKYYTNSDGSEIHSTIPRIFLFYNFTVKGAAKTQQRHWEYAATKGWEAVDAWKLEKVFPDEARALAKVLAQGVKVPKKPLTVITGPQVTGIIAHESCGHPFEADRILGREAAQAGESWITPAMFGQRLDTEAVTLVDNPAVEGAYGYYMYDDEGVKARKKYLVKNGLITEFYHNRETASSISTKSNGSARASDYDKEPLVRMSNTYFEPGKLSEKELIEETKHGVYFKSFTEWNIDDKRYNNRYVSSEAYLIENGRITKPVRNAIFELTTPKIYSSIEAVGNNLELHSATCGKGEPMQGMPVTMGGGSLQLTNI